LRYFLAVGFWLRIAYESTTFPLHIFVISVGRPNVCVPGGNGNGLILFATSGNMARGQGLKINDPFRVPLQLPSTQMLSKASKCLPTHTRTPTPTHTYPVQGAFPIKPIELQKAIHERKKDDVGEEEAERARN